MKIITAKTIQAVKGMNDILPEDMIYWQYIENKLCQLAKSYGYDEIRTPILEKTDLFQRSIGEVTDIVSKEMYTFDDRDGTSISLRPEGTAPIVRAGIEQGIFYNQIQRLWYFGPIFRHERPQRGRYRQFYQFGLEAIGIPGAAIEAEMILFNARLWKALGIQNVVQLQLNSLGSIETRAAYRKVLVAYFSEHIDKLDEDSKVRLDKNPLRILDSKNPSMQKIIDGAPLLMDYLDESSKAHFDRLQALLRNHKIKFTINPRIVRGLDYYSDTVFEWVTDFLGAQGTISAGGRYDLLIEQLGGQKNPAVGFAMGIERIIELLKESNVGQALTSQTDIYFILVGNEAQKQGLILAEKIRDELPALKLICHLQEAGFKSQFKKADKSGAKKALILGDDELANGTITIKHLRSNTTPQETIPQEKLISYLKV